MNFCFFLVTLSSLEAHFMRCSYFLAQNAGAYLNLMP